MHVNPKRTAIVYLFSIPLFCTNPYEAICNENLRAAKISRAERIEKIGDEIRDTALKEMSEDLQTIEPLREESLEFNPSPLELRKYNERYYERIGELILEYLNKNSFSLDVKAIKNEMRTAVYSRLQSNLKEELETIQDVRLILPNAAFFASKQPEDLKELRKHCDKDGMADNAFADSIQDEPVVLICPGAIIAAVEYIKEQKLPHSEMTTILSMTLGHEIGHHMDSETFPEAFQPIQECIEKSHRDKLQSSVPNYMREISADTYGNQILGQRLKKAPLSTRKLLLEGALEDLCDTEDDKEHPSGKMRLSILALHSISLRTALSCQEPSQPPLCIFP